MSEYAALQIIKVLENINLTLLEIKNKLTTNGWQQPIVPFIPNTFPPYPYDNGTKKIPMPDMNKFYCGTQ